MRTRTIALATLAFPLVFTPYARPAGMARPGVATAASQDDHYDSGRDSDRDRDAREQGHHDGMRAAYDDMRDGRRPDPDHHQEFRHPPVGRHLRDAYRDGFRDGYNDAMRNGPRRDRDDDDRH